MRSVLYAVGAERGASFERVLRAGAYDPALRLIAGAVATEADIAAAHDCDIAFIDLAVGSPLAVQLASAIRVTPRAVPILVALIGEPEPQEADVLLDAGVNMYFTEDPSRLAQRTRFLHGAVRRRGELATVIGELRESKERSARVEREHLALLECAPDGVLVYRDGRTVWANARMAQLLGYADPSELVAMPVLQLVPEHAQPTARQRLADRASGKNVPPIESPLVRRDGSEVRVLIFGMPSVFDGEHAIISFVRDLTEQRQLETQLMAADRMASLGRLAASVGHEINNPLTYVIGNLQLAARSLRRAGASPEMLQMLDEALEGADRVHRIVDDLRVFSQRQADALGPVDVGAVIASCIRMTAGELRHRARLVLAIDDVPAVLASEARLAQVITNLLLNAAQAMPDGEAETQTISVAAREVPGDRVEIRIEDTGAGIPSEHLPHVFEPFFTTKVAGTGLGLAICKMIVTAQGGDLALTSSPGRGTCATVTLAISRPEPIEKGDALPSARTLVPRRVLVIDDEARVAELLRDHLAPHHVTISTCGKEALAVISTSAPFDAIVCDLMMPDLGGADIHERLRADHPGLERKLVFMTGGAFTPRAASFVASVPNPCLDKPLALEALFDAIERAATR